MSALDSLIAQGQQQQRGNYLLAAGASHRLVASHGGLGSSSNLDSLAGGASSSRTSMPLDGSVESLERLAELAAPILSILSPVHSSDAVGASVQVVVVEHSAALFVPFIAAQETRTSSVLLWDQTQAAFVGMMTVSDFIRILVDAQHASINGVPANFSTLTSASIAEVRRQPWFLQAAEQAASRRPRRGVHGAPNEGTPRSGLIFCNVDASVLDALQLMISHGVATLPLLYNGNQRHVKPAFPAPAPSQTSSFGVAGVLTFPLIVQLIVESLRRSDQLSSAWDRSGSVAGGAGGGGFSPSSFPSSSNNSLLSRPIGALPSIAGSILNSFVDHDGSTKPMAAPCLGRLDTVERALEMFLEYGLNIIAIVDERSIIVDVVSRGDVLRMECCGNYDIQVSLAAACANVRENGVKPQVACCYLTDELGDVLCFFASGKYKEIFVVDPQSHQLVGYLSLRSVLSLLCAVSGANGGGASPSSPGGF